MDKIKIPDHILTDLKKHSAEIDENVNVLINRILKEWITINISNFPVMVVEKEPEIIEEPPVVEEPKEEIIKEIDDRDRDLYGED